MDDLGSRFEIEHLESGLRQQLRHVAAPQGFTDRVMVRVAARERTAAPRRTHTVGFAQGNRHAGWISAIAAMLLVAVGGDVLHLRHQRQEREAAQAQQQVDRAMELTSHALNEVELNLGRTHAGRYAAILDEISK